MLQSWKHAAPPGLGIGSIRSYKHFAPTALPAFAAATAEQAWEWDASRRRRSAMARRRFRIAFIARMSLVDRIRPANDEGIRTNRPPFVEATPKVFSKRWRDRRMMSKDWNW